MSQTVAVIDLKAEDLPKLEKHVGDIDFNGHVGFNFLQNYYSRPNLLDKRKIYITPPSVWKLRDETEFKEKKRRVGCIDCGSNVDLFIELYDEEFRRYEDTN